jgi:hypothetical protein
MTQGTLIQAALILFNLGLSIWALVCIVKCVRLTLSSKNYDARPDLMVAALVCLFMLYGIQAYAIFARTISSGVSFISSVVIVLSICSLLNSRLIGYHVQFMTNTKRFILSIVIILAYNFSAIRGIYEFLVNQEYLVAVMPSFVTVNDVAYVVGSYNCSSLSGMFIEASVIMMICALGRLIFDYKTKKHWRLSVIALPLFLFVSFINVISEPQFRVFNVSSYFSWAVLILQCTFNFFLLKDFCDEIKSVIEVTKKPDPVLEHIDTILNRVIRKKDQKTAKKLCEFIDSNDIDIGPTRRQKLKEFCVDCSFL